MPTADTRLREQCLTVLGSGYLRPANATWGALATSLIFAIPALAALLLLRTGVDVRWTIDLLAAGGALLAALFAIWWGEWAVEFFGAKDPRPFVLDEFAGQFIAFIALPAVAWSGVGGLVLVLGGQFVLFRIFDILKPPPANRLEALPAGWGITCDDLVAGLYANIAGQLLWRCTPLAAWFGLA